jgi:DNA-directed RNA polymerase omega subunit
MIHPSYVDLMNAVNQDVEEGETPIINSRYSVVMATAKRARQIVDGDEPMVDNIAGKKPLSIAIDEMEQGELKILPQDEEEVLSYEAADLAAARALENGLTEESLRESEEASAEHNDEYAEDSADDIIADEV